MDFLMNRKEYCCITMYLINGLSLRVKIKLGPKNKNTSQFLDGTRVNDCNLDGSISQGEGLAIFNIHALATISKAISVAGQASSALVLARQG